MHRITLERQQVWIYLAAIALGLGTGSAWPCRQFTAQLRFTPWFTPQVQQEETDHSELL